MSTKLVRQASWEFGEIDPRYFKQSDLKAYTSSAQELKNFDIDPQTTIRRRPSTRYIFEAGTNLGYDDNADRISFTLNGRNYLLIYDITNSREIMYHIKDKSTFNILNGSGGGVVRALDYTVFNDRLIVTRKDHEPITYQIDSNNNVTSSTIKFDVGYAPGAAPTYDFGDFHYEPRAATLSKSGDDITLTLSGFNNDPNITYSNWENGLLIAPGPSQFNPTGSAYIKNMFSKQQPDGSWNVIINAIEINEIDDSNPPSHGRGYSIQRPIWINSSNLGANYPTACATYSQRLWFDGGAQLPQAICGSQINKPEVFYPGVGDPTDAIIEIISFNNTGKILWINPGKQLEIYTENMEIVAPQQSSEGITPSNFSLRQQSSFGTTDYFKPLTFQNNSYFLAKAGNSIMKFEFQGIGQSYKAQNITPLSQHIINHPISRTIVKGDSINSTNRMYLVNQDKSVICLTLDEYKGSSGLTRYEFNNAPTYTLGNIEVFFVFSALNYLFMVKKYNGYGSGSPALTVERLEKTNRDVFLDCMLLSPNTNFIPSDPPLNANIGIRAIGKDNGKDYGILHLNSNSKFPNPDGVQMWYGLEFESKMTSNYVIADQSTSFLKKKVTRIYIEYYHALEFYVNGERIPYRTLSNIQNKQDGQYIEGTSIIRPIWGYHRYKSINISTGFNPWDLHIQSLSYQIVENSL